MKIHGYREVSKMMNEIYIFPENLPGKDLYDNLDIQEILFEEDYKDGYKKQIVSGVTKPSITAFVPENPNGTAIIVIPGGGYRRQVWNLEGTDIASWLNSLGITVFILKHRMPIEDSYIGIHAPLQDAQRGLRIIRSRAKQFGIDPNKIGIMGFSAGAHVASMLGTNFNKEVYSPIDEVDQVSARPNFMVLVYPPTSLNAYTDSNCSLPTRTTVVNILKEYPTNQLVTSDTPETFLVVADDDKITPSENSILFYLGLRKAGVPAEMHIFKNGGHGFGLSEEKEAVANWTTLCEKWLEKII